ncbi:iron complex transport system ATP-binding protein [Kitasatospora sp. SolWspMP-SS2h]|uniref:heme ABC transporter ATP-binding protein n=1 Tax=Kitasatospora sp. SolWspMP-SS2h TaxID=1305729 RepID=UPI000DB93CAE|nr:heme ABC transporter ATP-binding protein [Kitasatospora sp. SolWspMP-SS2h]RAJ46902.1 iron complex transport system ATP-binding protein [Kitasatospora sp. SolWspMP-SS2h]
MTVLLQADGIGFAAGGRELLADVDLAVRAGEILALLGPNGAGKSTLLSVLAGDQRPARGEVRIDGRPLAGYRPAELARRRALLPQTHEVSFPFPAVEVVRMGRAPWAGRRTADQDERAVARAMAATDCAHLAERPFTALSGGERARVALARVLAQDTALLLLDEPTAALDLRHQELVLRVARERADAGHGVVVVLHDLTLAAAHADRIALLDAGRTVAVGPTAEILDADLLSRVYRHPVEVLAHPRGGAPIVLPERPREAD